MQNRLIRGDCIRQLNKLEADSARLIVADPPYFNVLLYEEWDTCWKNETDYLRWTERWLRCCMRVLMPGGLLYCFGQVGKREHVMLHMMAQAVDDYEFHDLIIWDRVVGYNKRRDGLTPAYEMILVLRKPGGEHYFDKDAVREPYDSATIRQYARDKRYKNPDARLEHLERGKFATNLWSVPSLRGSSREKVGHPSQKPEALIERIVLSSTRPGDLVVDPFLGSGTTAVVAQKLGRRWIGIEKQRKFVKLARMRLDAIVKYPDVFHCSLSQHRGADDSLGEVGTDTIRYTIESCPLGLILLAASDRGVCAVALGNAPEELEANLRQRFRTSLVLHDAVELQTHLETVQRYLRGEEPSLDMPLDMHGSEFQQQVWQALRDIPYGETRTYSELAESLGVPSAVRVVARACASNPLALIIPCHRVVRRNGSLAGYRWGLERKKLLLKMESVSSNSIIE